MKSNYKRNVSGMQTAPQCRSLTKKDLPCKKRALKGLTLCKNHAFWPTPPRPRALRAADQRRAYIELQQEITREVREIEKMIRWARLNQVPDYLIDKLSERRTNLADMAERESVKKIATGSPRTFSTSSARGPLGGVRAPAKVATPTLVKSSAETAAERTRDRALGAMLGLTVGEAVGVMMAGSERSEREWSEVYGGGRLGLKRGDWAWDTAAALALAGSLIQYPSFDERDFIERLLEHRDHGSYSPTCEAVGLSGTTAVALNNFAQNGKIPAGDPTAARPTNGCLARMALVAIRFWKQPAKLLAIAGRQSAVTHSGHGLAQLCERFVEMLAMALADHSKAQLLTDRFFDRETCQTLTFGQLRNVPQSQILSGEDAEESFAAALWCVATGDGFKGAVLKALNLAGDAT